MWATPTRAIPMTIAETICSFSARFGIWFARERRAEGSWNSMKFRSMRIRMHSGMMTPGAWWARVRDWSDGRWAMMSTNSESVQNSVTARLMTKSRVPASMGERIFSFRSSVSSLKIPSLRIRTQVSMATLFALSRGPPMRAKISTAFWRLPLLRRVSATMRYWGRNDSSEVFATASRRGTVFMRRPMSPVFSTTELAEAMISLMGVREGSVIFSLNSRARSKYHLSPESSAFFTSLSTMHSLDTGILSTRFWRV